MAARIENKPDLRIALIVFMLAGCADDDSLQPPTGEIVHYKVDEQHLPRTNAQAREHALDINDDGVFDNQLGVAIATLIYQDADPTTNVMAKLITGEVVQLVDVQYASKTDPPNSVAFTLMDGSMTLAGDPLLGERTASTLILGPGDLTLTFGFYDDVVQVELLHTRVRLEYAGPTELQATIGGALRRETIVDQLIPGFVRFVEARVARDCSKWDDPTGCGCISVQSGTDGKTWLAWFDVAPKDCVITADEVIKNSSVRSLIAQDVQIENEWLLSFGIGIHATAF
jgi:hypothetical protein